MAKTLDPKEILAGARYNIKMPEIIAMLKQDGINIDMSGSLAKASHPEHPKLIAVSQKFSGVDVSPAAAVDYAKLCLQVREKENDQSANQQELQAPQWLKQVNGFEFRMTEKGLETWNVSAPELVFTYRINSGQMQELNAFLESQIPAIKAHGDKIQELRAAYGILAESKDGVFRLYNDSLGFSQEAIYSEDFTEFFTEATTNLEAMWQEQREELTPLFNKNNIVEEETNAGIAISHRLCNGGKSINIKAFGSLRLIAPEQMEFIRDAVTKIEQAIAKNSKVSVDQLKKAAVDLITPHKQPKPAQTEVAKTTHPQAKPAPSSFKPVVPPHNRFAIPAELFEPKPTQTEKPKSPENKITTIPEKRPQDLNAESLAQYLELRTTGSVGYRLDWINNYLSLLRGFVDYRKTTPIDPVQHHRAITPELIREFSEIITRLDIIQADGTASYPEQQPKSLDELFITIAIAVKREDTKPLWLQNCIRDLEVYTAERERTKDRKKLVIDKANPKIIRGYLRQLPAGHKFSDAPATDEQKTKEMENIMITEVPKECPKDLDEAKFVAIAKAFRNKLGRKPTWFKFYQDQLQSIANEAQTFSRSGKNFITDEIIEAYAKELFAPIKVREGLILPKDKPENLSPDELMEILSCAAHRTSVKPKWITDHIISLKSILVERGLIFPSDRQAPPDFIIREYVATHFKQQETCVDKAEEIQADVAAAVTKTKAVTKPTPANSDAVAVELGKLFFFAKGKSEVTKAEIVTKAKELLGTQAKPIKEITFEEYSSWERATGSAKSPTKAQLELFIEAIIYPNLGTSKGIKSKDFLLGKYEELIKVKSIAESNGLVLADTTPALAALRNTIYQLRTNHTDFTEKQVVALMNDKAKEANIDVSVITPQFIDSVGEGKAGRLNELVLEAICKAVNMSRPQIVQALTLNATIGQVEHFAKPASSPTPTPSIKPTEQVVKVKTTIDAKRIAELELGLESALKRVNSQRNYIRDTHFLSNEDRSPLSVYQIHKGAKIQQSRIESFFNGGSEEVPIIVTLGEDEITLLVHFAERNNPNINTKTVETDIKYLNDFIKEYKARSKELKAEKEGHGR